MPGRPTSWQRPLRGSERAAGCTTTRSHRLDRHRDLRACRQCRHESTPRSVRYVGIVAAPARSVTLHRAPAARCWWDRSRAQPLSGHHTAIQACDASLPTRRGWPARRVGRQVAARRSARPAQRAARRDHHRARNPDRRPRRKRRACSASVATSVLLARYSNCVVQRGCISASTASSSGPSSGANRSPAHIARTLPARVAHGAHPSAELAGLVASVLPAR